MRSNELRDDGASLTTFEDFAPIFYGSAFDIDFVSWPLIVQLSELEARVLVSDCCGGKRLTPSGPVDQCQLLYITGADAQLPKVVAGRDRS